MSDTVIKVENISKQYRLGNVGLGTLSHDINRWYHTTIRRREDPYLKIGDTNDRSIKGESDYVWALKDINFEVMQGEVLGIIGRNGAGKSTLLKILSRTTTPTAGQIKIKGRVASLLEVGTGFHPELTGRENIFLNGAILGMTKKEIKNKFDEIVDFAGVERYVDTPVKRYSSGMYVRLAFAVAAHLEPEILIVDEVLAVGDAEFQKKALGKMKEVSEGQGRTVLFVSHNMEAVQNLCINALLLKDGQLIMMGDTGSVIGKYMAVYTNTKYSVHYNMDNAPGNSLVKLLSAAVQHPMMEQYQFFKNSDPIHFSFLFQLSCTGRMQLDITYHLVDERGILVYVGSTFWDYEESFSNGTISAKCIFPANILNAGTYTVSKLLVVQNKGNIIAQFTDVLSFEIVLEENKSFLGWQGKKEGVLKLESLPWHLKNNTL
ncbi:MAG: ATP-binding cassette domain-containing protein [Ferruginibacter sp.]|nr:ATP-binding cassette domain-containing protein [Ferruginibacter sp.]